MPDGEEDFGVSRERNPAVLGWQRPCILNGLGLLAGCVLLGRKFRRPGC